MADVGSGLEGPDLGALSPEQQARLLELKVRVACMAGTRSCHGQRGGEGSPLLATQGKGGSSIPWSRPGCSGLHPCDAEEETLPGTQPPPAGPSPPCKDLGLWPGGQFLPHLCPRAGQHAEPPTGWHPRAWHQFAQGNERVRPQP